MKLTKSQIEMRESFLSKFKSGEYKTIPNPCICGKSDDVVIHNKDRYGIDLRTVLCKNCGLVRSDPYYDKETLNQYYSNEYRALYTESSKPSEEFFEDEVKLGEVIIKNINSSFPNLKIEGLTIYEVGCGAGGILYPFHNLKANVVGCDLGDDYLEIGRSKGMNLINGDIESLEQFGKADIIVLHHVVEHFLDPVERLAKVVSLLKPTGILYIAVPGLRTHTTTYGAIINYLQNAHVYSFTLSTLSNILNSLEMKEIYGNEKVVGIYQFGKEENVRNENINNLKDLLIFSSKFGYLFDFINMVKSGIKKLIKIVKRK